MPEPPLQERHTDPLQQIIEKPVVQIVEVEKIIKEPVEVEKIVYIEKPIEKIVYVDRPVQQPAPERITEKTIVYLPPEQRADPALQPDRTPPPLAIVPEVQAAPVVAEPERKNTPLPEQKIPVQLPPNNSTVEAKTIPEKNINNSPAELFEPDQSAPQADRETYKKIGKVGRKRKYEEVGENRERPVKDIVLYFHKKGRHWPGMSEDMQKWYHFYYFTKPSKTKDGAKYEQHVKAFERGSKWIREECGEDLTSVGNSRTAHRRGGGKTS